MLHGTHPLFLMIMRPSMRNCLASPSPPITAMIPQFSARDTPAPASKAAAAAAARAATALQPAPPCSPVDCADPAATALAAAPVPRPLPSE